LVEAARRHGTTPEQLAVESLRQLFIPPTRAEGDQAKSLYDFLAPHIGTISGSTEALSEDCGRKFADGLAERGRQERS
jgi:hypothetical protein